MGVAWYVFLCVSFRRTSEEAGRRRIRRDGVRRTHDRERQSMFLPRALQVVKCFFLGEVTRKEKTTQKREEKYSQRGRILS